jgi:hypothetical protein
LSTFWEAVKQFSQYAQKPAYTGNPGGGFYTFLPLAGVKAIS